MNSILIKGHDYKFNPTGFCTDQKDANINSIENVFGIGIPIKICSWHYYQSINKQGKKLRAMMSGDDSSSIDGEIFIFNKLGGEMMTAPTFKKHFKVVT